MSGFAVRQWRQPFPAPKGSDAGGARIEIQGAHAFDERTRFKGDAREVVVDGPLLATLGVRRADGQSRRVARSASSLRSPFTSVIWAAIFSPRKRSAMIVRPLLAEST